MLAMPRYVVEEFHCTPDGGTWCLTRDTKLQRTYVRHEASDAAGQTVTYKDVADFVLEIADKPQYHELMQLLDVKLAHDVTRHSGVH
jgi:hypothetical protein